MLDDSGALCDSDFARLRVGVEAAVKDTMMFVTIDKSTRAGV